MHGTEPPILSADELRRQIAERDRQAAERRQSACEVERRQHAEFARDFLQGEISVVELTAIRRAVQAAVADGKLEALVYTCPARLCRDGGRAINNADPAWPDTLQGKARALYDYYVNRAKPNGYRLKAMIVTFPGGMPGDVGFFLNWGGDHG
jgi:hypothetical protein